jgi:hypothetical protein
MAALSLFTLLSLFATIQSAGALAYIVLLLATLDGVLVVAKELYRVQ